MAPAIPLIEVAYDRNPARVWRPHRESKSVHAIHGYGMSPQLFVNPPVLAFGQQPNIRSAQHRREAVRILDFTRCRLPGDAQAVGKGTQAAHDLPVENPICMHPIEIRNDMPRRRIDDRYGHCSGLYRTHPNSAFALVHTQNGKWITVLRACKRFDVVILGYGLDPLAILVPFLVFAIGTSHGVQQLNMITAEITHGLPIEAAARSSFRGLLVPGSLSLVTAVVGFAALLIVPIPQIQELAVTASIGTGLKLISNLIMLPVIASYFTFDDGYRARVTAARDTRLAFIKHLGVFGRPAVAFPVTFIFLCLFGASAYYSRDRHVGDLHPGSPELRPDARYNLDAKTISDKFSIGLDLFTVIVETPPDACVNYPAMTYINEFSWYMRNVDGVRDVQSAAFVAKTIAAGWNEGNLKWRALPHDRSALVQATSPIGSSSGLLDNFCTIMPLQIFLMDGKATTLKKVVSAVNDWSSARGFTPVLSAGRNNGTRIMPPEFLPDGKPRRDEQNPTSTWTLGRDQVAGLTYNSPESLKNQSQTLTVKGYLAPPSDKFELRGLVGAAVPGAEGTIQLKPDKDGKAKVDLASLIAKKEFAKADLFVLDGVPDSFTIRMASGNSGVTAAVNQTLEKYELPSTLIVYVMVLFLTYITYFDWRAAIGCMLPLLFSTFFGYFFMMELGIGLKVSTLPVIVLVVGVGVDYAYYIYNRMQYHLSQGVNVSEAYQETILETGNGVFFTALNFALGVSTWSWSPLKFQADMGTLLTFMFMTNMLMALTALPGIAVVIDTLFPRKSLPYPGPEPGGHWH